MKEIILAIDIGHNVPYDTGAVGIRKEDDLNRLVGNALISKLRGIGVKVVNCTPNTAKSLNDSLYQRVITANNSGATLIGVNAEEAPKINKMLKRLEPTALPKAIPDSCFLAAVIDVTSSGSEVPMATMVRPIKVSLSPKLLAIMEALSTTKLPPQIIAAKPIAI